MVGHWTFNLSENAGVDNNYFPAKSRRPPGVNNCRITIYGEKHADNLNLPFLEFARQNLTENHTEL